jgi:hypothetical protein
MPLALKALLQVRYLLKSYEVLMPTFPTPRDAYFGNPATLGYQPDKLDLVRIMEQMQAIASTQMLVGFVDTIAALPSSGNTTGDKYAVMDVAPSGGIYNWTGTAWVKVAGLPVTLTTDEFAVLARAWAQNPEDVPVVTGPNGFSALHWAAKAAASAALADSEGNATIAQSAAIAAAASAVSADEDADRAEAARDAAFVNADVYPDIATGRAAVSDGQQFQVVTGDEIIRYRRDSSSTQTEMARYPSSAFARSRASGAFVRDLFDASNKFFQNIGRSAGNTLVTASNMGDATYVWAAPVTRAARLTRFRMFALISGAVTLRRWTLSGSVYTQVGADITINVAAGVNEIDLLGRDGLTIGANEFIGVYANNIGCSRAATGGIIVDSGGWYFGSGNVTTFTRGTLRTDFQIQMGFDFEAPSSAELPAISVLDADLTAGIGPRLQIQTIGRAVNPVAGAGGASIGVYVLANTVAVPGSLRRVRVWARAAATAEIAVYRRNATIGQFARVSSFAVELAVGLNDLRADNGDFVAIPVQAGDYLAISASGGVVAFSSATADGAGWYSANTINPETLTAAAVTTGLRLELGFEVHTRPADISSQVPIGPGWNHVIGYGQSNAVGATNGVVINDTASAYHLTFDSGVKTAPTLTDGNNPATGTQALVEDDISPITGLSGSIYGDVGLWQFAAQFSRERALSGVVPTLFCSTAGYSGAIMRNIAAGSPWWQVMIYHVRKAKEFADAAGVPYRVTAVLFDHGESDQQGSLPKATYRAFLNSMIDCFAQEVAAITGQTERPQWLFTTSPFHITTSDNPTEAVNEACRERADCHLVTGGYMFPHRTDKLHLTAVGQCLKRAHQARVLSALVDGVTPPAIRWLGATGSGTSVTVRALSRDPLEISTALVSAVTNDGFAVSDSGGTKTISSVVLGASVWSDAAGGYLTDVAITVSTSLGASPVIKYAKTTAAATPDITQGAAGNLFTDTAETVTIDGSAQSLAIGAPPVSLAVYVPE